ncbi:MAG: hypothetical protein AAFO04_29155 [Cyanobacteria bacterium J06592_8]
MTLSTLVNLLQTRAAQQPDTIAYTFLENRETPGTQLTYRQLATIPWTATDKIPTHLAVNGNPPLN